MNSHFETTQMQSKETRSARLKNITYNQFCYPLVKFSLVEKWESRSNKAKLFSRKYPRHKEEKTCALKITGSSIKNWVRWDEDIHIGHPWF